MTPNVFTCQSEAELEAHFANDFIAHIDGKKAATLRQFYEEIADLLEIPDFGYNLDALNDSINDLDWLEDPRIVLYFTNTDDLVKKEREPAKLKTVLSMLDAAAEDWKWVGDDEPISPKELILVFEDSLRIRQLLDDESIQYEPLAELK